MSETDNPFEILGVDRSASLDEVTAAWREKVKNLHPDKFPDVTSEVSALLTREVSRVNAAYSRIKDIYSTPGQPFEDGNAGNRTTSSSTGGRSQSRHQQARERPRIPACELCGSINSQEFLFSRQVGMLFARRFGSVNARMCRECALAVGRDFQSRTLTTGWWGAIAFFVNFGYLFRNASGLWKASRMEPPQPPPGFIAFPLNSGKPVLLRPFSWVGPVVVSVLVIFGATSDSASLGGPKWSPGWCVAGAVEVTPVSCSSPHMGEIVSRVSLSISCPPVSDGYVKVDDWYYCIDDDR